jgi:TP901 family phage tail tape measure protein
MSGETSLLGNMLVKVLADTKEYSHSIDEAQKQFLELDQAISRSKESIADAFRRINGEAAVWGNSTDLIAQKQSALKKEISSLIDQGVDPLGPRIEKLQNQYYKLGDESKALAKHQATLGSQLKDLDNSFGGIGQRMIALAANPIVALALAVAAVTKEFISSTSALVKYGDEMNDLSKRTNLSTTALQEYKFVAEQTGGSLETITSSVKLMTRGLDTNAETFKALGVQIKDANGNFRSTTEIFDDTVGALGKVTNETRRSKLALDILGRGAQDLVPLLKLGSDGVKSLKDEAHSLGLVMGEETIKNADELADSTLALKESWKAYTMTLVQDSLPALIKIADAMKNVVRNAVEVRTKMDILNKGLTGTAAESVAYLGLRIDDLKERMRKANEVGFVGSRMSPSDFAVMLQGMQDQRDSLESLQRDYKKAASAAAQKAQEERDAAARKKADDEAEQARREQAAAWLKDQGIPALEDEESMRMAAERRMAEEKVRLDTWASENARFQIEDEESMRLKADAKITESARNAARKQADAELERYSVIMTVSRDVFTQLGEDLARGEVDWRNLGTAAINSIGAIVYARGSELAAKGAATLVEAIAASFNPFTAWAAPGMYASAAQYGAGAAAAWAAGATLESVHLANGGLASRPTPAVVGDNPRYPEFVAPLSPEIFLQIGDGIVGALAARSNPAAGSGFASSEGDGAQQERGGRMGGSITIPLYVDGKKMAEATGRYFNNNQVPLKGRRR